MSSTLFGPDDAPDEAALPEPPAPEGPGLFGDAPPLAPVAAPPPAPPVAAPAPAATPYRVLARKYRPANFEELIGQDALVRTLRNAFAQNRVAHAFMLTGVRGVGKTTTARIIARALNCIGPDGTGGPTPEPCGVCPECLAILADRHPDVQELDAAVEQRHRRRAGAARAAALPPGPGALQGHHPGRGPHAVDRGVQRAAEDAGGTAGPGEIHAGDDRAAQGPGHHPLPLPDLPPASACRRPSCAPISPASPGWRR